MGKYGIEPELVLAQSYLDRNAVLERGAGAQGHWNFNGKDLKERPHIYCIYVYK